MTSLSKKPGTQTKVFGVLCPGRCPGNKNTENLGTKFFLFQKRKIATKGVFRARICVSTPELAMVFRGESVSGHPGARGGQKNPENHPENFQKIQEIPSKKTLVPKPWVPNSVSNYGLWVDADNDVGGRGQASQAAATG